MSSHMHDERHRFRSSAQLRGFPRGFGEQGNMPFIFSEQGTVANSIREQGA